MHGDHIQQPEQAWENVNWLIQQSRIEAASQSVPSSRMIQGNQVQQHEQVYPGRKNIDWLIQHFRDEAPSQGALSTRMIHDGQIQHHQQEYPGYGNDDWLVEHFAQMPHPTHQSATNIPEQSEQEAAYLRMKRKSKLKGISISNILNYF